jgi:hypothetical protein
MEKLRGNETGVKVVIKQRGPELVGWSFPYGGNVPFSTLFLFCTGQMILVSLLMPVISSLERSKVTRELARMLSLVDLPNEIPVMKAEDDSPN